MLFIKNTAVEENINKMPWFEWMVMAVVNVDDGRRRLVWLVCFSFSCTLANLGSAGVGSVS